MLPTVSLNLKALEIAGDDPGFQSCWFGFVVKARSIQLPSTDEISTDEPLSTTDQDGGTRNPIDTGLKFRVEIRSLLYVRFDCDPSVHKPSMRRSYLAMSCRSRVEG